MASPVRLLAVPVVSCALVGLGAVPVVGGGEAGSRRAVPPLVATAVDSDAAPAAPAGPARAGGRPAAALAARGAVPPTTVPATPPPAGLGVPTTTAAASPNMAHVANLRYEQRYGGTTQAGTDVELATIGGRDYAFAGTYRNGLQIIDVTDATRPLVVAVYDCAVAQGDVQVFRRDGRTLVAYTADDIKAETRTTSGCYRELGVDPAQPYGTFLVDVSEPRSPRGVSFVPLPTGSHNQTVHPGGRHLYNSNGDVSAPGVVEVVDVADLERPRQVATVDLGAGANSHDVTFNADGTRAYAAALTHTVVLDTTDPARPRVVGRILDPSVNIHHQADPVTVDDPLLGRRTFLVVSDELAGAAGNGVCPGGGLHVYDITGEREALPVKVGFFAIPDARPAGASLRCTSHVLRMYPEHKLLTIAWYAAGVRVVDISGLAGVSVGLPTDAGMREVGYYALPDADTWSAKTNRIAADGSFFLFANDVARGFDVYRFRRPPPTDAAGPPGGGRWLSPEQLPALARSLGPLPAGPTGVPFCLVP